MFTLLVIKAKKKKASTLENFSGESTGPNMFDKPVHTAHGGGIPEDMSCLETWRMPRTKAVSISGRRTSACQSPDKEIKLTIIEAKDKCTRKNLNNQSNRWQQSYPQAH